MRILLSVFIIAVVLSGCSEQPEPQQSDVAVNTIQYPQARRSDHVDTYFGRQVADPYRWFEDLDSEETADWVATENAIAKPYLEKIPQRETIKQRLQAVWDHERFGSPSKEGGKYFYFRNNGLQNQSVLYVTDSLDVEAEPKIALDPNTFSEDGTVSLASLDISPSARYIAYSISDGGSDWDSWHVVDLTTGTKLDDMVGFTKFTDAAWRRDESGFYYSRYPEGKNGEGDDQQAVSVYFHRLGTAQSEDQLVYALGGERRKNPYAEVSDDDRYLVIFVETEGVRENAIHYRHLDEVGNSSGKDDAPIIELFNDFDAVYNFIGNVGDQLYFWTDLNAPRGRVIVVNPSDPTVKQEVLPQADDVLRSVSLVGGRLVATYLHDARGLAKVFDLNGNFIRDVDLPGIGSVGGFSGKHDDVETFYSFASYTRPNSIYRYDVKTGNSTLWKQSQIDIDLDAFTTEQVFYNSKDGTRVPMFITHRKDLKKNGNNPTLLYGYGGFNVSQTPGFSITRAVWLEMGGVLVVANLRGGGEYGEEWHQAGTKLQKQNVFDDFIAAAEYLIDKGYTQSSRLAIQGGSNGGLLVGAAITQRPDLFGAALPAVGVLDMLRYHTASANARAWSVDYGLSENKDEFEAQLAYSPVHNVKVGTCYPPTLITTADHDDRVVPWHSFKFGAELQYAQGCDNPILVRVETRAGHGAGTPTWMQIENYADQWAFLVKELGVNPGG